MKTSSLLLLGVALAGTSLAAQETTVATADATKPASDSAAKPAEATKEAKKTSSVLSAAPTIQMQYFRPVDQRGLNQFETTKEAGTEYKGFAFQIGAAFTQQFQGLGHENTAAPRVVNGVNQNQLIQFGHGFFFGGVVVRNV